MEQPPKSLPGSTHPAGGRVDPIHLADAAFDALRIPRDATLSTLMRHVELARDTTLHVEPLDALLGTAVCGLLLARPGQHTIYYVPAPSALHEAQCILHELSHMLLRHDELSLGDEALSRFTPDIRLDVGDRLFGRVSFTDDAEIAAERLADRLAGTMRSNFSPGAFEDYFG